MISIVGFISRNPKYSASSIRTLWAVRKSMMQHKAANPVCDSCGRAKYLHTHHIEPVHINALRADDQSNMQTLCKDCHWTIGHACNWHSYVLNCQAVAHAVGAGVVR